MTFPVLQDINCKDLKDYLSSLRLSADTLKETAPRLEATVANYLEAVKSATSLTDALPND